MFRIAVLVLAVIGIPVSTQADQIAYLSYGKLFVYESGKSRMVSDQFQYQDVKWYKNPVVAVVRAGNIELVDTTNAQTKQLTTIGNIRQIAITSDKKNIVFARITVAVSGSKNNYDICLFNIGKGSVTTLARLQNCDLRGMLVESNFLYCMVVTGREDVTSWLKRFDLSKPGQQVKVVLSSHEDIWYSFCSGLSGIIILGSYFPGGGFQEYGRFYIAEINRWKPKLERSFLDDVNPEFQIAGCCLLSDGRLLFGVRGYDLNGDDRNSLFSLDRATGSLSRAAEGYCPDAVGE